jgi:2-polyprenyl-6-methoxyphenol hydroxylase-like FAD-dependent oxidoreductase
VDPSYWTSSASQEDLHSYIKGHLDGLGDGFTEPIRATPVHGMFHPPLQMRDMTPPVLPPGRVTLLGDAIHPMVPFRGEGGNMAMKDGMILAQNLALNEAGNVQEVLKLYEAEMSERTTKSVLASRAAAFA